MYMYLIDIMALRLEKMCVIYTHHTPESIRILRRIEALGDPFACVSSDDNGLTTEDELETALDLPSKRMCPNSPTVDSGSE